MRKWFIKDSEGNPSITTTAFFLGFLVVNLKLLAAGLEITDKFKFSQFSGVEYGAALAALGGVYILRKNKPVDKDK